MTWLPSIFGPLGDSQPFYNPGAVCGLKVDAAAGITMLYDHRSARICIMLLPSWVLVPLGQPTTSRLARSMLKNHPGRCAHAQPFPASTIHPTCTEQASRRPLIIPQPFWTAPSSSAAGILMFDRASCPRFLNNKQPFCLGAVYSISRAVRATFLFCICLPPPIQASSSCSFMQAFSPGNHSMLDPDLFVFCSTPGFFLAFWTRKGTGRSIQGVSLGTKRRSWVPDFAFGVYDLSFYPIPTLSLSLLLC